MKSDRLLAVERAAQSWANDLADLSGPLWRYRDLRVGTLDLTPSSDSGIENQTLARLLRGGSVRLSQLWADAELRRDAGRRLAAVHKKAQSHLEEKGVDTLFLAVGLATWSLSSGTPPNAPVVLLPLVVVARDASLTDFDLEISGEPEVNPILKHHLLTDYKINLADTEDALLETDLLSYANLQASLDAIGKQCAAMPDLRISPRLILSNFSYTNMPMVQDLQSNLESFAENDLVSAIAKVPEALQALRSQISDPLPNQPDLDPPQAEFLILDADSSQHRAINRVLNGESLVIWGPPGTGKSQTISNLIATLMSNGKRVLFVAEKQAAIQVVTKWLDRAGLSMFVVNIHGGVKSKREFASDLANALRTIGSVPEEDYSAVHVPLADTRTDLIQHHDTMHQRQDLWGLTPFETQNKLIEAQRNAWPLVTLASERVRHLEQRAIDRFKRSIQEWVTLEGYRFPAWARTSTFTPDEARRVFDIAQRVSPAMAEAKQTLFTGLDELGLERPRTIGGFLMARGYLSSVNTFMEQCHPSVYSLDHASILHELATRKGFIVRALANFSSKYRQAKQSVVSSLRSPQNLHPKEACELIQQAIEHIAEWDKLAKRGGYPNVPSNWAVVDKSINDLLGHFDAFSRLFPSSDLQREPFDNIQSAMETLSKQDMAARLPRLVEFERELKDAGFGPLISAIADGKLSHSDAVGALEHSWAKSIWGDMAFRLDTLGGFTSESHDRRQTDFVNLDRKHLEVTPNRARRAISESAMMALNNYPEEAAWVREETAKRRRLLPVRQLFQRAPNVLTAIRPCWMMSPLLVAETIPAGSKLFDVVIFDEASQIPPAEAIGSLSRASQAVIAGDDRQLPPTTFFKSQTVNDDDPKDDQDSSLADFESILDVAKAGPIREQMLEWHYRSKDGRLIQFSNAHIYGGALTAFPGIDTKCPITHHLVHTTPIESTSHVSHPDEVRKVVDLVFDHARLCPTESLGVIAFGNRHANNIEMAFRQRLRELGDPHLDEFFSEMREERFFIKNIETVQGDEREVIILSVGYHKDANGRLMYRFGPLNQDGGQRRLNVAITRARSRVHLVSSFSHHDMDPGRSSAEGVELLRQYLEFAASGGTELRDGLSNAPLNPFELEVMRCLSEKGVPVTPQYGVAGFRIDFACAHPEQPGRMVLAIEADGASYHSGHTARDRDRLRQQVLEDKGWRFHRIWSTEWFRDRGKEVDRAVEAWKQACEASEGQIPVPPAFPIERDVAVSSPPTVSRGTKPRIRMGLPIIEYSHTDLVALAKWILSDTLLRTDDDLRLEMMRELGFRRRGHRIDAALARAIDTARR